VLPSRHRLTSSRCFADTVRRGRRAGSGVVVAHLLPAPHGASTGPVRVGLVVGRKVGPAVQRNRVKRRLRHALRDRLGDLPLGATLVVRALPGAADRPYAALTRDLDRSVRRVVAP
jgi:ribonuclease P protein component